MGSKYAVDERVRKVRVGGEIHEIVEELVEFPQGEVTVELNDADSGKLVHRETAKNFIAAQWAITSRSVQRWAWDTWIFNQDAGIDFVDNSGFQRVQFPNQAVACWYDATAEAPATEHTVRTNQNGIVAWAGRLPVGSPTGSRGAINVSTSTRSLSGESLVYDWPNTTGNGTFRSVGYTAMYSGGGVGYSVPLIRARPAERKYLTHAGNPTSVFGSASVTGIGQPGLNSAGDLIIPVTNTSNKRLNWFSIPSTTWDQAWAFDAMGAAEDTMSPTIVSDKTLTGNGGNRVNFIGGPAGYIWVGYSAGWSSKIARVDTTSFVVDREVTLPTGGLYAVGTMIGTDAFVGHGYTGTDAFTLWRYDTTVSPTPTLTATISLSVPSWFSTTTHYITAMVNDGTNIWCYFQSGAIGGWIQFDTSGSRVSILGEWQAAITEVGSTPFAATKYHGGLAILDDMRSEIPNPNSGSTSGYYMDLPASHGNYQGTGIGCGNSSSLAFYGNLGIQGCNYGHNVSLNSFIFSFGELGHNLGSRVLLGSDTTKTSSNTMKITYNVTLPDYIP